MNEISLDNTPESMLELALMAAINAWLKSERSQGQYVDYTPGDTTARLDGTFAIDDLLERINEVVVDYKK